MVCGVWCVVVIIVVVVVVVVVAAVAAAAAVVVGQHSARTKVMLARHAPMMARDATSAMAIVVSMMNVHLRAIDHAYASGLLCTAHARVVHVHMCTCAHRYAPLHQLE